MSKRPVATLAAVTPPTDPYATRERHHNEGHGRRLTTAFEALEAYPVLVESRNRVLRLFENGAVVLLGVDCTFDSGHGELLFVWA